MYSDDRSQDGAAQSSVRGSVGSRGRESFRPVALPALAAAVHIQSAEAARAKLAARRQAQIFHEDEPVV